MVALTTSPTATFGELPTMHQRGVGQSVAELITNRGMIVEDEEEREEEEEEEEGKWRGRKGDKPRQGGRETILSVYRGKKK